MSAPLSIAGGDRAMEQLFVEEAEAAGLHYLFGHPVAGGIRVTMYVGLPDEAVHALTEFMREFQSRHSHVAA